MYIRKMPELLRPLVLQAGAARTQWFPAARFDPARRGEYETHTDSSDLRMRRWNGRYWKPTAPLVTLYWRGLVDPGMPRASPSRSRALNCQTPDANPSPTPPRARTPVQPSAKANRQPDKQLMSLLLQSRQGNQSATKRLQGFAGQPGFRDKLSICEESIESLDVGMLGPNSRKFIAPLARCGCGAVPIPGDSYCYTCKPE
jgi:hypothetical protein